MGREEPSRPDVSERDRVDEEPFRLGYEAYILELEKRGPFHHDVLAAPCMCCPSGDAVS